MKTQSAKALLVLFTTFALIGGSMANASAAQTERSGAVEGPRPPAELTLNLNLIPEGDLDADGVMYNDWLKVSSPDERARISHSQNEWFEESIGLFPGEILFEFDALQVNVSTLRYEVFNNNASSVALAAGTAGTDFDQHPNGFSQQELGNVDSMLFVEMSGLESVIGNIVVEFRVAPPFKDSDGDGVVDSEDNCTLVRNPRQRDTDKDGYGNLCDVDLNNDLIVNFLDLALFRSAFFSDYDENADFNGDGQVDLDDLEIMKRAFFAPPGPAAGPRRA